jgi:hypothetical protein
MVKKSEARLRRSVVGTILGVGVLLALAGCLSQARHLYSSVDNPVELRAGAFHEFALVRVYADDGELVIYGKVRCAPSACSPPPHVVLAILDVQQRAVVERRLPLVDRGRRRRGWAGAAFRTRIPGHPQAGESIRLVLHDEGCAPETRLDCGSNAAVAPRAAP